MNQTSTKALLPLSPTGFYHVLLWLGWLFCLGYGGFLVGRISAVFIQELPFPLPGTWFFMEWLGLVFIGSIFLRDNHQQLGEIHAHKGQFKKALFHFHWALRLNPFGNEARVHIAHVLSECQNWAGARDFFEKALKRNPNHIDALNGFAFAFLYEHNWQSAQQLFHRAYLLKRGAALNQEKTGKQAFITQAQERSKVALQIHKLRHDFEQLSYLETQLPELEGLDKIKTLFQENIARYEKKSEFSIEESDKLAHYYLHNLYWEAPRALDEKNLIQPPSAPVEKSFKEKGCVYFDDVLVPEALNALYQFCLRSTIWHDSHYKPGYLGSNLDDGFSCPLIFQIAEQLRGTFPEIFKDYPLVYAWAFKCDSETKGVDLHGDSAFINVNFWLTPDEANLNPNSGGLSVYTAPPPEDWDFQAKKIAPDALKTFAEKHHQSKLTIPYKQNRMVIFNSQLLHESDDYEFQSGYLNRRINVTLLFGLKTLKFY